MSTTPTNLPVPSEKPQDLKFNAGKIDEFVTSMAKQYIDRFGHAHYTIEGLRWVAQQAISAFGYITLKSFQLGAPLPNNELTLPNQVLQDETDGEYYRWDGVFPKVVPAGSTPDSTGGTGIGKWISVGDASLRSDLLSDGKATLVGYRDGTVADELDRLRKRSGDVVYAADYLPVVYTPGEDVSSQLLGIVAAVNSVPNTEWNGKPVILEFPSGWFKHSTTLWFTRPVVFTSQGDTKLEYTGTGNQIIFGPDNITLNGVGGSIDHKLHVTYGFIGNGIFTFTGDLTDNGIVFNEFVTNPRLIGLRFVNYGSETFYQIKLWGHCWDITLDNVRHTNTQSKAVNFLSANGKMKDGTVDFGNSRLHVGTDVYLHIEGSRSGGVCFDVGGADYRFDGVAQGWRIAHQLGAFASNPRINGYHETIYPECETLITYGGLPGDSVVPDDHYFKGGVIGGDSIYWNAHNFTTSEGYPPSNCRFMKPGRTDVVLKDCRIGYIDLVDYDTEYPLVFTNVITGRPSFNNYFNSICYDQIKVHEQDALIQPWISDTPVNNLVINGSGLLSRNGSSFTFNSISTMARTFDFWAYTSDGASECNFYRNLMSNDYQFTHEGTNIGIVVPVANNDNKSLQVILDKNAFKCQGKNLTLSFMLVNADNTTPTKLSVALNLSFSPGTGVSRVYSFGEFTAGPSWGLKKFTLNIPFEGLVSDDSALAYLSFDLPKNQKVNVRIANINLCEGTVAMQGPAPIKYWDLVAQSKAYYGS
ncbi:hypothetical protein RQM20_013145 [Citrobacter freundii]|uniref:tail fiber/spike domain-containing protein n=1 Tax=Citrobacter freundii TaxID=546 RepID=UPI0028BD515B|nr:hypothetical protein [Citrobacter freundii]MDT7343573.1 hypothetical protein [Citrobacter freundii]